MHADSAGQWDEWRVTGDPGRGYGEYGFTWSAARGDADPEKSARGFIARIRDARHPEWADGPHLSRRSVTVTEWEPAS